ncbi:MAG: nucleotide pyrophosphohydrolase [Clostridia bacterium]|jgi:NTP pyrophosphatase (non-canonical NTP hydrolase)|nr:nucleotide pyrophosphohydrolase [Clostridia bacterium]
MDENKELSQMLESFDEKTSLKDLQDYAKKMIQVRGFDEETPQDVMLLLTEEIGELAKEIRKASTNIKCDVAKNNESNLANEIADVFNYVLAMCKVYDLDLLEVFKAKERTNMKRKWN